MPFSYGFRSENAAEPSSLVTVLAVWNTEGESLCRAFRYDQLLSHRDTLRLRFALTSDDLDQCRAAFASYDSKVGWPRKLEDRERAYEGFAFEVEEPAPNLELTVRRFHGDAISATTRYRVNSGGVISDVETSSTGPGNGLLPVLGGFAGAVVWLLWALWFALNAWRKRKSAPDGF
jgi:hypothetical protein